MRAVLTASPLLARQLANVAIAGTLAFLVCLLILQVQAGPNQLAPIAAFATSNDAWLYHVALVGLGVASAVAVGGLWSARWSSRHKLGRLVPLGLFLVYCV